MGTGDFAESDSAEDVQTYAWGDPGEDLAELGFAPASLWPAGTYYLYLVADDYVSSPVFAVSDFAITVDHAATTGVAQTGWARVKLGVR